MHYANQCQEVLVNTLNWKKSMVFLVGFSVVSILFDFWVPLWIFSLVFWVSGLYLGYLQSKQPVTISPSERALLLQNESTANDGIDWSLNNVLKLQINQFFIGFKRPFDERVFKSFTEAVADCVDEFEAVTGYVFSANVLILFPSAQKSPQKLKAFGKKTEIVSAVGSFLASRLKDNLRDFPFGENESQLETIAKTKSQFFVTGNLICCEDRLAILNFFMNAFYLLCKRSAVDSMCSLHFIPSEISGMSLDSKIKKLQTERKIYWKEQPVYFRMGAFVKRIENNGKYKTWIGSKIICFSDESNDFLFAKYHRDTNSIQGRTEKAITQEIDLKKSPENGKIK